MERLHVRDDCRDSSARQRHGERRGLTYDAELLYLGALFHDMGLTARYVSPDRRFEVDGAHAARDFMTSYGVPERAIEDVWTAIALHTTPGIPHHMRPTIALVTAGVEMDVLGLAYDDFTPEQRDHVAAQHPRGADFKANIIRRAALLFTPFQMSSVVASLADRTYRT